MPDTPPDQPDPQQQQQRQQLSRADTLAREAQGTCRSLQISRWWVVRIVGWSSGLWVPGLLRRLSKALLHTLPARILFLLGFSSLHTLLLTLVGYMGVGYECWARYPALFLHLVATLPPLLRQLLRSSDSPSGPKSKDPLEGWEAYWSLYALGTTLSLAKSQRTPGRTRRPAYWIYMVFLLWAQGYNGGNARQLYAWLRWILLFTLKPFVPISHPPTMDQGEGEGEGKGGAPRGQPIPSIHPREGMMEDETVIVDRAIQEDPCPSLWSTSASQEMVHEEKEVLSPSAYISSTSPPPSRSPSGFPIPHFGLEDIGQVW
ncbi:MAG: hypothetical protein DHS80DRAFT_30166 [Piptocephalis tieghemiana]|nr:MAG: hypothetical protein DHS80DRAFT_30166 [Piptocephalis tieghemiana]